MPDASHAKANGPTPRAGLLCLPTLSTHGYEVTSRSAIDAMAAIVVDFVVSPDGENWRRAPRPTHPCRAPNTPITWASPTLA